MIVVIDRFEGQFAVCEKDDRTMVNINRSRLPADVQEGDVLVIQGDSITIDRVETANRRAKAEKQMKDLWR